MFEDEARTHLVHVITPVSLFGRNGNRRAGVFIREVRNRKPVFRCVEAGEFERLVAPLLLAERSDKDKPAEPFPVPEAGALVVLKTGRLPAKLAAESSDFLEPIPHWLTSGQHELRLYAAGLVARRPVPADVSALRSLIVRSGPHNDHAARLGCQALRKLGTKATEAIPELLRAAAGFTSGGCPQRFADAASAILKIAPRLPPQFVQTCIKHLKVNNYAIQKVAIEALVAAAPESKSARDALRRLEKLRGRAVQGKPVERLLQRVRARLR